MNKRLKAKRKTKDKVLRQPLVNRIIHWGVAISTFMLIITGIGQMPVYQRYLIIRPFGTEWLTNYINTLWVHYFFAITLLFFISFHLVYHGIRRNFALIPRRGDVKQSYLVIKAMILRQKEPPCDKYLPEQRLAYAFFAVAFAIVVVTGIIKVIKNVMGITPTNGILFWGAQLHNLGTVLVILGIVLHLAAFLFKDNRKLLPCMFTGYMDKKCAMERHSLWYQKLEQEEKEKHTEEEKPAS